MEIKYSVKLLTPCMTASLGVIGKDIDATVKLDGEGLPYFSGKHIKGIVRERVGQFKRALEKSETTEKFLEKYFGKEGNYLLDNRENKIRFSNLKSKSRDKNEVLSWIKNRHGIKVDRKTRTAKDSSLFNYEFVASGTEFEGSIEVSKNISYDDLRFILASLFHLEYIGGLKSRGLGKIEVLVEEKKLEKFDDVFKKIKSELDKERKENKEYKELTYKKYSYSLVFDEPFIFTQREIGNYIEVRNSIQGSSIRGAMIDYFVNNYGIELSKLFKVEASSPEYKEIKLASEFSTKYPVKSTGEKARRDKVIYRDNSVENVKLERGALGSFSISGNEMSVKIDERTKSAQENMLFNTEFVESPRDKKENKPVEFKGDIILPQELIETGKAYSIQLGKLKFKGFGKAKIIFTNYVDKDRELEKKKIVERIEKLDKQVKNILEEKDKEEDIIFITFDLLSDLVLPFIQIYDVGEQFKILANLQEKYEFDYDRSFINTGKLEGYNIINNCRKMDELILIKGSVLTYRTKGYKEDIEKLVQIELEGLGLRKNEGFGRVQISSERGGN